MAGVDAPNEIEVVDLVNYQVAPDGSGVRMNVTGADGNPASVILPTDCLRSLALSMPKMVSDAVSGGRGDPSIRVAHSVGSWFLERSRDGAAVLLTIETGDLLRISFALSEKDLAELLDAASTHEIEAFSPQVRGH